MKSKISIVGKTKICGIEVPKIAGGFGEGKKAMLAKTIGEMHDKKTMHVNEAINNNRNRFKEGIDIIDVKNTDFVIELVDNKILSKMEVAKAENIFAFSERGYAKLLKIFDDDLAWDKYEEILDGYFHAEELKVSMPSYMIEDPEERALHWIGEHRERKALERQKMLLEQSIKENAPKIAYYDTILNSKGTVTTSQIAKDYGLTANELNKILKEEGIQYKVNDQWLLVKKYDNKGYTQSSTFNFLRSDGRPDVKMNTRWTQTGRLFIHEILTKRGIKANIEKDYFDAK